MALVSCCVWVVIACCMAAAAEVFVFDQRKLLDPPGPAMTTTPISRRVASKMRCLQAALDNFLAQIKERKGPSQQLSQRCTKVSAAHEAAVARFPETLEKVRMLPLALLRVPFASHCLHPSMECALGLCAVEGGTAASAACEGRRSNAA